MTWNDFIHDRISSRSLRKATGKNAYHKSIGRIYSKYTSRQLRKMHAEGTPVKNPAQALQMNKLHAAWQNKKFGHVDKNLFGAV